MGLFQQPARTPEQIAQGQPLDISPEQVDQLDEATWYAKVYRGDQLPQLTYRAVAVGACLGFLLAFTNLYIGLKTGWALGVAITACIMAYSLWNGLLKLKLAKTPLSILETNCMQSTASAAGYSTGSSMVSAIAALLIMSASPARPGGQHLPWHVLGAWTFFLAVLGVCLAIPMKRSMINHERLRFPSGIAAATTLQSLYSHGGHAVAKARALFISAVVAGITPLLMDLKLRREGNERMTLVPDSSAIFDGWLPALGRDAKTGQSFNPSDWTLVLDHKLVMLAAGALVGLRVCIAMVLGSLLLAYWVGPLALQAGATTAPGSAWHEIGVWVGAPIMVSSGLLSFAFQWRTIVRAFSSVVRKSPPTEHSHATAEVPLSWFVWGVLVSGLAIVWISDRYFAVPWHLGIVAVAMTYFLSLVACRATGESDITPVGAMGKITQLTYGALVPQSATANLMTAAITASAAASSADLLTDLKSGYLLGADPRRQFIAQFLGIFSGTVATVMGFYLLVPDATAITGVNGRPPEFPAPSAQSWLAVAQLFQSGLQTLSPMARTCLAIGLSVGIALTLLERWLPNHHKWIPSGTGLGLGFILPFQYPLSMLIGAIATWLWHRKAKHSAEKLVVPLASGAVAGESIVGVLVAAINNLVLGR